MSERLKVVRRSLSEPAGNGNAGLASNFLDLAHVKLKPGGVGSHQCLLKILDAQDDICDRLEREIDQMASPFPADKFTPWFFP